MDLRIREYQNAQQMRLSFTNNYIKELSNKMSNYNINRLKFNFSKRKIEWQGIITEEEINITKSKNLIRCYENGLDKRRIETFCEFLAKGYVIELKVNRDIKGHYNLKVRSIKELGKEI